LKHNQYKSRPRLEDFVAQGAFDDEIKRSMLAFAAYLRTNKMPPQWAAINSWKFLYQKQRIGYIRLIDDAWFFDYIMPKEGNEHEPATLTVDKDFETFAANENLQDFILANIKRCAACISTGHCSPKLIKMFGQEFKNLCWNGELRFKNPGPAEVERLTKLYNYLRSNT